MEAELSTLIIRVATPILLGDPPQHHCVVRIDAFVNTRSEIVRLEVYRRDVLIAVWHTDEHSFTMHGAIDELPCPLSHNQIDDLIDVAKHQIEVYLTKIAQANMQ